MIVERTVKYFRKRIKCSQYQVSEKLLIRYGKKGKKSPKQRFVLLGKVVKVGKHGDNYKIDSQTQMNEQLSGSLLKTLLILKIKQR